MSTLLDRIETRSTNGRTGTDMARRRPNGSAPRWPPVGSSSAGSAPKKSLTAEQRAQAAEPFDAEGQFLLSPARSCWIPSTTRTGPSPRSGPRSPITGAA